MQETVAGLVGGEFVGGQFGDPRRAARLRRIVDAVAKGPAASFPALMEDDSQLEALYRFVGSPFVSPEAILEPHNSKTRDRCTALPVVVVAHDTTEIRLPGEVDRSGMGRLSSEKRDGFLAHFALAIAPASGEALGVLGLDTWTRQGPSRWKGNRQQLSTAGIEPQRWGRMVDEVEGLFLGSQTALVHVMDREADQYDLFAAMHRLRRRFVIRLTHDRRIESEDVSQLREALATVPVVARRTVQLSRHGRNGSPRQQKRHPARDARETVLSIRTAQLNFRRPPRSKAAEPTLTLNVVHALEEAPPFEEKPVEWLLITTENVEGEGALDVLDHYRSRWVIEEYFKALKTGCSLEKRQAESYFAFVRTLAILVPIAWGLLVLRDRVRATPDAPASHVLTARQLAVLREYKPGLLPKEPTTEAALYALAKLGGHIKNNGPPGWQVLGRGYEKLVYLEAGWAARESAERSDR